MAYPVDSRFHISNALAFDALCLQTINITEALVRVTKLVMIHGFDFTHSLEHVLMESMYLGMHTGIVHFSLGDQEDTNISKVIKYVWVHHDYQPWGMELPMQCPQCGTVQKWASMQTRDGGYMYECVYRRCGYDGNARRAWSHMMTVEHPKGATLLKLNGGQGGWMRVSICELL